MDSIELVRPSAANIPLLTKLTFMTVAHTPFETEEEMLANLQETDQILADLSLIILYKDEAIGALRIGPYAGRTAILQYGLVPPFNTTAPAQAVLQTILPDLMDAFTDLESATYEEPYREAFENSGFEQICGMFRVVCPIVRRDVPTHLKMRLATRADEPALAQLMSAAYDLDEAGGLRGASHLFDCYMSGLASYVGIADDGSLAAASLISGRKTQRKPCLAHAITHPKEQRKGWGTALVQASMNVLADMGCTHLQGWAHTTNAGVLPLHRRFGLVPDGPLLYQGDYKR